jgi:hypothetical protein
VNAVVGVAVRQGLDSLPYDLLRQSFGNSLGILLQLIEDRVVTELEDEVESFLPPKNLHEVVEVGVLENII